MDNYQFRVYGFKKNGDERNKTFAKINHALRYMWRIKEAREVYLEIIYKGKRDKAPTFAKIGRRRGINSYYVALIVGLPSMPKAGAGWKRLPSKYNEIIDNAKAD